MQSRRFIRSGVLGPDQRWRRASSPQPRAPRASASRPSASVPKAWTGILVWAAITRALSPALWAKDSYHHRRHGAHRRLTPAWRRTSSILACWALRARLSHNDHRLRGRFVMERLRRCPYDTHEVLCNSTSSLCTGSLESGHSYRVRLPGRSRSGTTTRQFTSTAQRHAPRAD